MRQGLGVGRWGLGNQLPTPVFLLSLFLLHNTAWCSGPRPPAPNPYDSAMGRVRALSESDHVRMIPFGESGGGRAIPAFVISDFTQDSHQKARVMIVAGQHGDEVNPVASVLSLAGRLASRAKPELLAKCMIVVMPIANPDGYAARRRLNGQGLDVNRDWTLLKTPEARFVDRTIRTWQPQVVIDAHEWMEPTWTPGNEIEVAPSTRPGQAEAMIALARQVEGRSGLVALKCRSDGNPTLLHHRYTSFGRAAFLLETSWNASPVGKDHAYRAAILTIISAASEGEQVTKALSPLARPLCVSAVAPYLEPLQDTPVDAWDGFKLALVVIVGYCLIVGVMKPFPSKGDRWSRRFRNCSLEPEIDPDPIRRRQPLPPITVRSWVSRRLRARYAPAPRGVAAS